jgi:Cu2+-containing amine oxidase
MALDFTSLTHAYSGHPEPPHHRKHAFDLGEYGAGYLTNSLSLGCDCKGTLLVPIHL